MELNDRRKFSFTNAVKAHASTTASSSTRPLVVTLPENGSVFSMPKGRGGKVVEAPRQGNARREGLSVAFSLDGSCNLGDTQNECHSNTGVKPASWWRNQMTSQTDVNASFHLLSMTRPRVAVRPLLNHDSSIGIVGSLRGLPDGAGQSPVSRAAHLPDRKTYHESQSRARRSSVVVAPLPRGSQIDREELAVAIERRAQVFRVTPTGGREGIATGARRASSENSQAIGRISKGETGRARARESPSYQQRFGARDRLLLGPSPSPTRRHTMMPAASSHFCDRRAAGDVGVNSTDGGQHDISGESDRVWHSPEGTGGLLTAPASRSGRLADILARIEGYATTGIISEEVIPRSGANRPAYSSESGQPLVITPPPRRQSGDMLENDGRSDRNGDQPLPLPSPVARILFSGPQDKVVITPKSSLPSHSANAHSRQHGEAVLREAAQLLRSPTTMMVHELLAELHLESRGARL